MRRAPSCTRGGRSTGKTVSRLVRSCSLSGHDGRTAPKEMPHLFKFLWADSPWNPSPQAELSSCVLARLSKETKGQLSPWP